MYLTLLLHSTMGEIIDVLTIKSVSIIGLLLAIIIILIYDKLRIEKKHEEEKTVYRQRITDAHNRLQDEYKNSNIEIKSMIEKYYTISTKVLETLNSKL